MPWGHNGEGEAGSTMATLWESVDRFGRVVRLTEEGWSHIVTDRKRATPSIGEVRAAVEAPTRVTVDAKFAQRECYYRGQDQSRLFLKVVVHYRPVPPQGTWEGTIITAFFVGSVPRREAHRWP
jgi:hypothetical protein